MAKFTLSKNTTLCIKGNNIRLKCIVNGIWQYENIADGAFGTISNKELQIGVTNGDVTCKVIHQLIPTFNTESGMKITAQLDLLPKEQQEALKKRRFFIEKLVQNYGSFPSAESIQSAIKTHWRDDPNSKAPSVAIVTKWKKRYLEAQKNILSLMDRKSNRGNRVQKLDPKLHELTENAIRQVYMKEERNSLKVTLNKALILVDNENKLRPEQDHLRLPTINTIRSVLNQIDKEEIYIARHGIQAARIHFRESIGHAVAERPMQRIEIDHTRLNIIIVDDLTGLPIGRPWLTVAIDYHTKMIVGIHLSMVAPCYSTIAAVLKMLILPKAPIIEKMVGLRHDWPVYGVPENIVVDNGPEFHSDSLENACLVMGITIAYCPRKTPWWKGSVERVIGTMNRSISGLTPGGRTFDSIQERGDYDAKKTACVTLDAVRTCLIHWIVDIYHQQYHRGSEISPQKKWDVTVDYSDLELPTDSKDLEAIAGNLSERRLWHYGFELNHVLYNSKELMSLKRTLPDKIKLLLRWDSEDLGSIKVMVPNGGILTVPATPKYKHVKGVSLYQYQLCRADLINRKLSPDDPLEFARAEERISLILEENAESTKLNAAKFKKMSHQKLKLQDIDSVEDATPVQKSAPEQAILPTQTEVPDFNISHK